MLSIPKSSRRLFGLMTPPTKRPPTKLRDHLFGRNFGGIGIPLINKKPNKLSTDHSQLIPAVSDYPKYWPLCLVKTDFAAVVQNSFLFGPKKVIFRQTKTWICLLNMLGTSDPNNHLPKFVVKDGDESHDANRK